MSLAVAIAELLMVTESGAELCAAGDASIETMLALADRRAAAIACIERLRPSEPLTAEMTAALQRASDLGDDLLAWCDLARAELDKARSRVRTNHSTTSTPARLLSDVA
jgi:hypothetical protein